MGWAQWQGGLSLSAAVTQSRANTLGTAERAGGQGGKCHQIHHANLVCCVRPRTHWPLTAMSFTPPLWPCSEDTDPEPCCHLLRTCSLSFLQDTSDRALQWVISLFFSWDRKCSSLGWFWAAPLKKLICHMLVSAENAQGLRNHGVCWEPRIQEWSSWVEPYFQWSKGGLVHSPGPTPPLALSCNL